MQVFSDELSVSQSSTANGRESSFDLVVIRNATLADLEAGRELLNPGAWLYVEVERPQRRKGRGPLDPLAATRVRCES